MARIPHTAPLGASVDAPVAPVAPVVAPVSAQDYLTVAHRAKQQAQGIGAQIADTRNRRADTADALDALDADRAQELTRADGWRAQVAPLEASLASATTSARLFEDTPAEAETAAKAVALQDDLMALTAQIVAFEATAAEREAVYTARRHELSDALASCDDVLATLEGTRADVIEAGRAAFASAGEALALARVSEITTLQARLRALDHERADARLDLRTAQATLADDLSAWPELADQVLAQYGPPTPADDERTAMLEAWQAFLRTLPAFARADHEPVNLGGGMTANYFQCTSIPDRFWPLMLGYSTSIMGADSPDAQRDTIIREKLQLTDRVLSALRNDLATQHRDARSRRR